MTLKHIVVSIGLAAAVAGSSAFAENPERDTSFAVQLAMQADKDHSGMVTKAEYLKMLESRWDKMAKGAKELSTANTAKIFMDTGREAN